MQRRRMRADGIPKSFEDECRRSIAARPVLRMPLDGEHKTRRILNGEGFDGAIGRHSFQFETGSQIANRLAMERVHRDFRHAKNAGQHGTAKNLDLLANTETHIMVIMFRCPVVHALVELVNFTDQTPAKGDIEFLKPAANGK